jgi:hypothetical protein
MDGAVIAKACSIFQKHRLVEAECGLQESNDIAKG